MTTVDLVDLSPDGLTLVLTTHPPDGVLKTTIRRKPEVGPFTHADIDQALARVRAGQSALVPGEQWYARRWRAGRWTLWLHVNTGPPTWWKPQGKLGRGEVMVGWLRALVAVKVERA